MDGTVEIRITGTKAGKPLMPDTYDIAELRGLLENVDAMLFPGERKNRPLVSYEVAEGSVKNIFRTSLQVVIGFNALLSQIEARQSIDFLEEPTGRAIEAIQNVAIKQNYTFTISTSLSDTAHLNISSATHYQRTEPLWVHGEFYLYGDIVDMGGKTKANIHIQMPGHRSFAIEAPREFLKQYETNPLYKPMGIHVRGRQNPLTGEIDRSSLVFLDFVEHDANMDSSYLDALIKKATPAWQDIKDVDSWVQELRGG